MVVPVAVAGAKGARAGARAASANPTATVLVGIVGLVVLANAVSKVRAPFVAAGEAAEAAARAVKDVAEDAARETQEFFSGSSSSFEATDILRAPIIPGVGSLLPTPTGEGQVSRLSREFNTSKAFLGGVFVGPDEDLEFVDVSPEEDFTGYYPGAPPAVPLATPTYIYQDAQDAGRAIRDFFGRLF